MVYPKKDTPLAAPVLDVIRDRWSPVIYSGEPVSDEAIASLFEAARWAPSCFGEQPWRFVYAKKGTPERAVLDGLLAEGNAWAKDAGLLIVSFSKKTFTRNNKDNYYHLHDLGAANVSIALQATALGLLSHQMAGFDSANANTKLGVPADFAVGSMIAIGHPGDTSKAAPDAQKRDGNPRTRMPREEFAFQGGWKK
jgi:nitroreductase